MSDHGPVVVTEGLTKKYGEFVALDDLSISLERGHVLGFIGPNGAGKTTTIRILVGLARPTSGNARIAGVDCARDSRKIKRLVGYMPDRFGSYDNMRVREYLDFFGATFGIPRKQRARRIDEVLETTNALWMKDRYVESLSHGMAQRVGIARTLLHDPEVLILDEPANGLDPEARVEMRHLLLRLAEMGKTLIVTSHILPELARVCDVIAIITQGRLRAFGTLDHIMRTVTQERTIEVQLTSEGDLERAAAVVRRCLGEGADAAVSPAELMVRFRTARREKDLGELLATLVRENLSVTQFRELQSDLEEAFLSVTRTDAEARPAGPAPPRAPAARKDAPALAVGTGGSP
ncbi:MAG TPA: ABC transporter ATP-binding protein [Planctomycetaceae bacterium]|nr:ABC transporter ATP-binding protein [Planctomycetaceae bacterium]